MIGIWIEGIVCVLLTSTVLVGLLVRLGRPLSQALAAAAVTAALLLVTGVPWSQTAQVAAEVEIADNRPIEDVIDGYVSSNTCGQCHPHQYHTWHGSYHRTMTQVASPKSVLGNFENVQLEDRGRVCRLQRRGDEYWFDLIDPAQPTSDGSPARFQRSVVMTTGSHHMQLYWYPTGSTRLVALLPFAFLLEEQRWIPREATFLIPPLLEPTMEVNPWNEGCIKCHATHGRPGLAAYRNALVFDTRVAEFGISCEACHGPGHKHVQANRDPSRRYQLYLNESDRTDDTIIHPAKLSARKSSEVCGQCHSVFHILQDDTDYNDYGFSYRPGDKLGSHKYVVRCGDPAMPPGMADVSGSYYDERFWSDGMVRVSGREFNGLVESPCFQRGELSCLSCHQMHKSKEDPRPLEEWANDQLLLGMDENQACTQCHDEYRDAADVAGHTHHDAQSSGSQCYNCHMPHTTYGLMKAIRSHQISSPTVNESLDTGRPNACNQCHLDQTLSWTAEHLNDWYGIEPPELGQDETEVAASILWLLRGEAGQRALMAWSYGWQPAKQASGSDWMAPYLGQLLLDPYHAVRFIAQRSLRRLPNYDDLQYDFLSPPTNRSESAHAVFEQWSQRSTGASRNSVPRLLVNDDGKLNLERFSDLLEQRDDRHVVLSE